MEFDSHLEVEKFYEKYAKVVGFGIHKYTLCHSVKEEVIWCRWTCSC